MFFIVPEADEGTDSTAGTSSSLQSADKRKRGVEEPEDKLGYYPKRIPQACERCRLKKTRCTGGKICARCKHDRVVCVTGRGNKKSASLPDPAYVHLVESQRDQLAHALDRILQTENTPNSSKLRSMLVDMGITTQCPRGSNSPALPALDTDRADSSSHSDQLISTDWKEVFDNLNSAQIQAIESFCGTAPQVDDFHQLADIDDGVPDPLPQAYGNVISLPSTQSDDFGDIVWWGQDATFPEQSQTQGIGNQENGSDSDGRQASDWTLEPTFWDNGMHMPPLHI